MNTPTDRQTEKEKEPAAKPGQPARPGGQAGTSKRPPAVSPPTRTPQRTGQSSAKTNQPTARAASQPPTKTSASPSPRAAAPPAPKPRDPSVARRDERREERRAEIQARQQARRLELQRAKRQTLLIRYDLIIAPILLVGLVVFFVVTHQPLDAIISGVVIFVAAIALLAFAALMPTRATGPSRPNQQAEAPKDSPPDNAQPPAGQPEDQAASGK